MPVVLIFIIIISILLDQTECYYFLLLGRRVRGTAQLVSDPHLGHVYGDGCPCTVDLLGADGAPRGFSDLSFSGVTPRPAKTLFRRGRAGRCLVTLKARYLVGSELTMRRSSPRGMKCRFLCVGERTGAFYAWRTTIGCGQRNTRAFRTRSYGIWASPLIEGKIGQLCDRPAPGPRPLPLPLRLPGGVLGISRKRARSGECERAAEEGRNGVVPAVPGVWGGGDDGGGDGAADCFPGEAGVRAGASGARQVLPHHPRPPPA